MSTYTTVDKVERELNGRVSFDENTIPSLSDVNDIIEEESSWIDEITDNRYSSGTVTEFYSYRVVDDTIMLDISSSSFENLKVYKNVASLKDEPVWEELTVYKDYLINKLSSSIKIFNTPESYFRKEKLFKVDYQVNHEEPAWLSGVVARRVAHRIAEQVLSQSLHEGTRSVQVGDMRIVKPRDLGVSLYESLKSSVEKEEERLTEKGGFVLYGES